jgi:hypothetical protein
MKPFTGIDYSARIESGDSLSMPYRVRLRLTLVKTSTRHRPCLHPRPQGDGVLRTINKDAVKALQLVANHQLELLKKWREYHG